MEKEGEEEGGDVADTGCISGFEMRRWPEQQHGLFWWRIEIGVVID